MPEIYPDLKDVQSNVIPPGVYEVTIESVTPGTSGTGNPKVDVVFTFKLDGREVNSRPVAIPTTGKGAFRFQQLLRACGFRQVADALKAGPAPFNTDDLEGQRLRVQVDPDEYQGEPSYTIEKFIQI
jgi:hypothetical protein